MAMKVDEVQQKIKIKNQMQDFLKKYNRKPSKEEYVKKFNLPCARTINKYYGSKDNLYRECGLSVPLNSREVRKEDVIKMIQDFHVKNGRLPLKNEFTLKNDLPTVTHIQYYFKGIEDAKRASGFKIGQKKEIYTKEEVILAIQNFYKEMERPPFERDIKARNGFPSINKVRALFGTMRNAREEAGLLPTGTKKLVNNKEDIEELLLQKYIEKKRRLKALEIDKDKDLPKYSTVCIVMSAQSIDELWNPIEKKYKRKLKSLIKD